MRENEISFLLRKALFRVYNTLGPGLFESVYVKALKIELEKLGLEVRPEVPVPFIYDELRLDAGYRMDLLVNDLVVVEVKSIESLSEIHHKQLLTYLKLSGKKLGLLVNFNTAAINSSIVRKVCGL